MKKTSEQISYYYKHYKVLFFVPLAFILIPFVNDRFEEKYVVEFDEMVYHYYKSSFSGVIVKTYIDKDNHSTPTIRLKKSKREKLIYLNYETPQDFKEFKVNDTLVKEPNQNKIIIKRNGEKLIRSFKFNTHIHREKYPKNLDTIVQNYLRKNNQLTQ